MSLDTTDKLRKGGRPPNTELPLEPTQETTLRNLMTQMTLLLGHVEHLVGISKEHNHGTRNYLEHADKHAAANRDEIIARLAGIDTNSLRLSISIDQLMHLFREVRNDQREIVRSMITPERLSEVHMVDFANRLTPEQRALLRQTLDIIDRYPLERVA